MEQIDRTNKCYRSKQDKEKATIFTCGSNGGVETPEAFEERINNIRANKGKWVWDEKKRELVRAEEYYATKEDVDAPKVSMWQEEWAVLATGRRMSKGELKRYCREHNKTWENA